MGYFDQQLTRFDGGQYLLSKRFFFHSLGEAFGGLKVYVSIEKCLAHFFQGLPNIYLCDLAVALEDLKGAIKPFLEIFEHSFFLQI